MGNLPPTGSANLSLCPAPALDQCSAVSPGGVVIDPKNLNQDLIVKVEGPFAENINLNFKNHNYIISSNSMIFKVPLKTLVKQLKAGEKAVLTITNLHGLKTRVKVQRSPILTDLPRKPGFEIRDLHPLYEQIAADKKNGKPFSILVFVALWDKSFELKKTPGARRPINDGDNLDRNLYWRAKDGAFTVFSKSSNWTLVADHRNEHSALAEQAIFKSKPNKPEGIFKDLGVKDPFEMYAIFNAYRGRDIEQAYAAAAKSLYGDAQVVGYSGHLDGLGVWAFEKMISSYAGSPSQPKGFFAICCYSYHLANASASKNVYGLLFTTGLMYPGAFTHLALFDALGRGKSGEEILKAALRAYRKHQNSRVGQFFVSPATSRMDRFWDPYR